MFVWSSVQRQVEPRSYDGLGLDADIWHPVRLRALLTEWRYHSVTLVHLDSRLHGCPASDSGASTPGGEEVDQSKDIGPRLGGAAGTIPRPSSAQARRI
eukprot:492831-Prorocentrum_minimum.AAC.1